MYPNNKVWQIFCDSFDKNIEFWKNPVTVQLENYEWTDKQKEILNSIYEDVETIRTLQSQIDVDTSIRSTYKYELDHKSNTFSVSNQLSLSVDSLQTYYKKCILDYFNICLNQDKENFDNQTLQQYFHELLGAYIIWQRDCKERIRKYYLEKHTDKYGLFDHLLNKLRDTWGELLMLNDHSIDRENVSLMIENAKNYCIKRILKCKNIILDQYWMCFWSEEEKDAVNTKAQYLIDKISNDKKDQDRWESIEADKKLLEIIQLFEKYEIDEKIRYSIPNIRDAEYLQLQDTMPKFKDMLAHLYEHMTDEEREDTYNNHSKYIIKDINTQWSKKQKKLAQQQLSLFPMTIEENRIQRIIALQYLKEHVFSIEDIDSLECLIEKIVFANNRKIARKKTVSITKENRKKDHSKKEVALEAFFQYIIDKEINQEGFSEEEQEFLFRIKYQKEPLYDTYPLT